MIKKNDSQYLTKKDIRDLYKTKVIEIPENKIHDDVLKCLIDNESFAHVDKDIKVKMYSCTMLIDIATDEGINIGETTRDRIEKLFNLICEYDYFSIIK